MSLTLNSNLKEVSRKKTYIWFVITMILLSICYSYFLSIQFHIFKVTIIFHALLNLVFYFSLTLFGILLMTWKGHFLFSKWMLIIPLWLFWLFTCFLYIGNYVSLTEWGQMLSFHIVLSVIKDFSHYAMATGFNVTVLLIILFSIALLLLFLSHKVVDYFAPEVFDFQFLKNNGLSAPTFVIGILFFTLGSVYWVVTDNEWLKSHLRFNGDVYYGFLKPQPSLDFSIDLLKDKSKEQVLSQMLNETKSDKINNKNVILIIIDALRADRLSMYGYNKKTTPFLDSLYSDGLLHKVEFAFSNCSTSYCGILSVLSASHIFNLSFSNYKIHDVLKNNDYKTAFLLGGAHNDWYYLKRAYEFYFPINHYFEGPMSTKYGPSDDRGVIDALEDIQIEKGNPNFYYIHLMSVHRSGLILDANKKYLPADNSNYLNTDSTIYSNNYDNGVYQVDNYIRRIFEILKDDGILQNSLVVITADHGEAIGEHNRFGHAGDIFNYNIRIPLIFYDSDSLDFDIHSSYSQSDIGPLILDALDIPVPSIWVSDHNKNDKLRYIRQSQHIGVMWYHNDNIYKFVSTVGHDLEYLFNILNDPNEQINLLKNRNIEIDSIYRYLKNDLYQKFDIE